MLPKDAAEHIIKEVINKVKPEYVYLVYYNSESSCDDGIESVHSTLEAAANHTRKLLRKMYDDEISDDDLSLINGTTSTKGVNMTGWSIGTYNIYKIPFM